MAGIRSQSAAKRASVLAAFGGVLEALSGGIFKVGERQNRF